MIAFGWDAILSFSTLPLRISTYFGFVDVRDRHVVWTAGVRPLAALQRSVPGWATLVVLRASLGGAILVCLGMVGGTVGRIYEEIKQRPIYIVRRRVNAMPEGEPPRSVVPPAHPSGATSADQGRSR
jgi:hypothetical protein